MAEIIVEFPIPLTEREKKLIHRYKGKIVGEIVRCKECKHRDAETGLCEGRGWVQRFYVPDGSFCDKGERKRR